MRKRRGLPRTATAQTQTTIALMWRLDIRESTRLGRNSIRIRLPSSTMELLTSRTRLKATGHLSIQAKRSILVSRSTNPDPISRLDHHLRAILRGIQPAYMPLLAHITKHILVSKCSRTTACTRAPRLTTTASHPQWRTDLHLGQWLRCRTLRRLGAQRTLSSRLRNRRITKCLIMDLLTRQRLPRKGSHKDIRRASL